ncbi:HupE/UreJ family protein [Rhizobium gallicum]|uniref:HupE/UreJ family protein n=1 Tax=Rhizobium gallicum TaxID=56730 RepID=UPI001EF8D60C|nr:HupE/UreJ family protein [Rhizobium gallicum]ULJ76062.1 HupE/UreJ family protein [Rhizobium gallicum]
MRPRSSSTPLAQGLGTFVGAVAFALFALAVVAGSSVTAAAHEIRPAYLDIREDAPGEFSVLLKTPMQGDARLALAAVFSGKVAAITPVVSRPTGDAMIQTWRVRAIEPLAGQRVAIDGLRSSMTDALVRVEFTDGGTWVERLTPSAPEAAIPATLSTLEVAATYVHHGIEHILFGFDHLLFVAALMLIVREWRVLVKTITAFTVAHSITLTLATLGWVAVPSTPMEAMIALSILLLATEIVRKERGQSSLTITSPWVVAFAFGLLHGFGFAGALLDLGLPRGDIPLALLSFNIGVEIGQLLFIAAILLAVHSIRRILAIPRQAIVASAYVIGTVAAFWSIERLDSIFL